MYNCKITVLRRMANPDLVEAYMGEPYRGRAMAPCSLFHDGQEFIVDNYTEPPKGFCTWAWADIHREIAVVMSGGDLRPWMRQEGLAIACCTDGLRPVVFKIERLD